MTVPIASGGKIMTVVAAYVSGRWVGGWTGNGVAERLGDDDDR